jgi:RNA-splicing ligase RtcB
MDSPPVLFEVGSELGESYVAAMELAGEYAYAGRDVVVAKVLEIVGAEATHDVNNHHTLHGARRTSAATTGPSARAALLRSPARRASSAARWATSQ